MFKKINFAKASVVASASALALMQQAHAALPEGATEAIAAYKTDVIAAFGLMIAAGIAIYAVRKLGSKMGWL